MTRRTGRTPGQAAHPVASALGGGDCIDDADALRVAYHPLLAVAAGSGEVLMARLRKGRAHSVRGAAHFLRETVTRVRAAGASGPLTLLGMIV